ncbi:IclR family transcriptional regulator [Azospirillum baldaniorum]|uniref:IclR family transcriptional regulator n=1 Tax=Azospirillum argentinense TaxID=2970906 RepID=A0ABW8VG46_9PROT|nr:IclR family transcriptional regulator [Azospirillum baldaniorum]TWA57361.1 IclR family transcriptional regulator [Azospirillum baldaniorum]
MLTSIKKATTLIEAFIGERREWTVLDLARHLGMPQPTVHHFLASFREAGWITQDPATRRYRLATRLWEIGCAAVNFREVAESARPHLRTLVAELGETVHLGVVPFEDPRSVVYIDRVDGTQPVRVVTALGSRVPSHSSAMGKAIVAHNPAFEAAVLNGPLDTVTPDTITDPDALRKEFELTRQRGYSLSQGEYFGDMVGIAAPVRERAGGVTLGIGLWAPSPRMTTDSIARIAPRMLEIAALISADLGHIAPRS